MYRDLNILSCKRLSELDFKFNTISFNIPGEYFLDSDKLILKLNTGDQAFKKFDYTTQYLANTFFLI